MIAGTSNPATTVGTIYCGDGPGLKINFSKYATESEMCQFIFKAKPKLLPPGYHAHLFRLQGSDLIQVPRPSDESLPGANKYWILFEENGTDYPPALRALLGQTVIADLHRSVILERSNSPQPQSQPQPQPQMQAQSQPQSQMQALEMEYQRLLLQQQELERQLIQQQLLTETHRKIEKELQSQVDQLQERLTERDEVQEEMQASQEELEQYRREMKKLSEELELALKRQSEFEEDTQMYKDALDKERELHADLRALKNAELSKQFKEGNSKSVDMNDVYDIIFKLRTPKTIDSGWSVSLNTNRIPTGSSGSADPVQSLNSVSWRGTVVSVVGGFDKGKSLLLNKLVDADFPSACRVHTQGLSFKQLEHKKQHFILVDSAGRDSAIVVNGGSDISINDAESEDRFISDVVFDISDIFIYVVNEISAKEQFEIHRLTKRLRESSKRFKDLFIVVNLKHARSMEEFSDLRKQHIGYYPDGQVHEHLVNVNSLGEKYVAYLSGKDMFQRHFFMAYEESPAGKEVNAWTLELIRNSLSIAVVSNATESFSAIERVKESISRHLTVYTTVTNPEVHLVATPDDPEGQVKIKLKETPDRVILSKTRNLAFSLHSSNDNSASENVPAYDARRLGDSFVYMIEAPGLNPKSLKVRADVSRSTLYVSYTVPEPMFENTEAEKVKSQRRYGEFMLTLQVPPEFHCEKEQDRRKVFLNAGVIVIKCAQREQERIDEETEYIETNTLCF